LNDIYTAYDWSYDDEISTYEVAYSKISTYEAYTVAYDKISSYESYTEAYDHSAAPCA